VVIMLTVLMGTVYPLLVEGLGLGKLSVGAPYFNAVFVPLMIPLLLFMGIGIHLKWNKDSWQRVLKKLTGTFTLSFLLAFLVLIVGSKTFNISAFMGLALAFWVIFATIQAAYKQIILRGLSQIGQAYWGMILAHLGVATTVIGIAVSNAYGVQDDVYMKPGTKVALLDYSVEFVNQEALSGPNYKGTKAEFKVSYQGKTKFIYPEKRLYNIGQMAMTESAIDVTPFRDIYIALGEPLSQNSWSVRLYYKPLIRWIWAGGFMILAGGLFALSDRRYYQKNRVKMNNPQELKA
jgi:cytochrome c-type biogenesis protein CcmF